MLLNFEVELNNSKRNTEIRINTNNLYNNSQIEIDNIMRKLKYEFSKTDVNENNEIIWVYEENLETTWW